MREMNLFTKYKQTYRHRKLLQLPKVKVGKEKWIRSLGLVCVCVCVCVLVTQLCPTL